MFSDVQGVVDGCDAILFVNSLTWSTKLRTLGSYGATRLASVVAPPSAKSYESSVDKLYSETSRPIQLAPPR